MGCHTSFFPFSEDGEWGRGTLSLMTGAIFGEWRVEKTSSPWMKKAFRRCKKCMMDDKTYYKKCTVDDKMDFKSERVNRA